MAVKRLTQAAYLGHHDACLGCKEAVSGHLEAMTEIQRSKRDRKEEGKSRTKKVSKKERKKEISMEYLCVYFCARFLGSGPNRG